MKILDQVRNILGMDPNYFYTAIVTVLISIITVISRMYSISRNTIENNLLDLHKKVESDLFFVLILVFEIFLVFTELCLILVIDMLISRFSNSFAIHVIVILFLSVLFCSLSLKTIMHLTYVRKRFLDNSKKIRKKFLIIAPMIILYIVIVLSMFDIKNNSLNRMLSYFFIIVEICGYFTFKAGYVRYLYSSICIYLSNGEVIDCKDISKVNRKYKSVIILQDKSQIRIKYDSIVKLHYYGDEKIILKD